MRARAPIVLIASPTSDIGRAIARVYARHGWALYLVARDAEGLERERADLAVRTAAEICAFVHDALQVDRLDTLIDTLPALPQTVICTIGELGNQQAGEADCLEASRVMRANFEGPALLIGAFAERFERRGSGTLVGIASVAGDRGRGSNYIYGSSKAGFSAFLSGLRNRLARKGVRVVTVKPGFVRTRMTARMKLPPLLTADPADVAHATYMAAETRPRDVIYVRRLWRPIMALIQAIPETLFKRMKL